MPEVKFETLKNRAKSIIRGKTYGDGLDRPVNFLVSDMPFVALFQMAVGPYLYEERPALVEFAKAFEVTGTDHLAHAAKHIAQTRARMMLPSYELLLIALKAREEAFKIIDRWDVRRVGKLIELFPDIVPSKLRDASLSCYVEDSEDGDWMVSFDVSQKRQVRYPAAA